MSKNGTARQHKCGQCGITDAAHRELYGTPLGCLDFHFQPDQGPAIDGKVHLCRPCTHEVLSIRLLEAAGVSENMLVAETWS